MEPKAGTVKQIFEDAQSLLQYDDSDEPTDNSLDEFHEHMETAGVDYVVLTTPGEHQALYNFLKAYVDPDLWFYTGDDGWDDFIWFKRG